MVDAAEIKARLDLVKLIEDELGPPQKAGAWLRWLCPFHPDHEPSLAVGPERSAYKCFACGAHGDALTWLQKRYNLDFPEALERAAALVGSGGSVVRSNPTPVLQAAPEQKPPPGDAWQDAAWSYLVHTQEALWHSSEGQAVGLAYLRARGLRDDTILDAALGWSEGIHGKPSKWGLKTHHGQLLLSRGVTIPLFYSGHIWGIKTRAFAGVQPESRGGRKYRHVPGGSDQWPYDLDGLRGLPVLLICEGEFDAILCRQELGDLVDVTACKKVAPWVLPVFSQYRQVIAVFDRDQAGEKFGANLREALPKAALVSVPVEENKADVTAFYQRGGDLRAWLKVQLWRLGGV